MKLIALSPWKEKKITKKDTSRFKQHVINVLLRNEETLSDGYGYYCEGGCI